MPGRFASEGDLPLGLERRRACGSMLPRPVPRRGVERPLCQGSLILTGETRGVSHLSREGWHRRGLCPLRTSPTKGPRPLEADTWCWAEWGFRLGRTLILPGAKHPLSTMPGVTSRVQRHRPGPTPIQGVQRPLDTDSRPRRRTVLDFR